MAEGKFNTETIYNYRCFGSMFETEKGPLEEKQVFTSHPDACSPLNF